MTPTYWHALLFTAPETAIEAVSDALLDAGALSIDVADAEAGTEAERAIFREPIEASPLRWNANRVTAMFNAQAAPAGLEALAHALANDAGFTAHDVAVTRVNDADWVRLTQSQFAPIEIEPTLWIVPTWCTPPRPDALNLVLDPGMAFGTGSHPTTALCLRWLAQGAREGWLHQQAMIDYGCGSGILAIAAARLGTGAVLGTDIDAHALDVARDNALRNHAPQISWCLPAEAVGHTAPIVVANILSNPLCVLAPLLSASVAPGGRLALSGVLAEQVERVTAAYAPWIALTVSASHDGWQLLTGQKDGEAT